MQVAAYDFILTATVNETAVPSPAPTPIPSPPVPCRTKHIVNPRPKECNIETPRRKIVATALRELLQLSSSDVKFSVSSAVVNLATGIGQSQVSLDHISNTRVECAWGKSICETCYCLFPPIKRFQVEITGKNEWKNSQQRSSVF